MGSYGIFQHIGKRLVIAGKIVMLAAKESDHSVYIRTILRGLEGGRFEIFVILIKVKGYRNQPLTAFLHCSCKIRADDAGIDPAGEQTAEIFILRQFFVNDFG